MAAYRFKAKIEHSEETIQLLYKVRRHTYEKLLMILRVGLGFAMILAVAFLSMHIILKSLLLLVGAWLIVSADFRSQMQADAVMEARKGMFPRMDYEFHPDRVAISGEGSMTITYKKFEKIVEDNRYFYLFQNPNSVCMIDRDTLKPADEEDFKKFIADRTGLEWQRDKSMLSMNIYDVRELFTPRRRKNNRSGKRK